MLSRVGEKEMNYLIIDYCIVRAYERGEMICCILNVSVRCGYVANAPELMPVSVLIGIAFPIRVRTVIVERNI